MALIRDVECYGFELVQQLRRFDGMVTSEGTIYPLLSRLRKEGMVETTWRESGAGPPRRYYRLAPAGRQALAVFVQEWERFRGAVDSVLQGESDRPPGSTIAGPSDDAGTTIMGD